MMKNSKQSHTKESKTGTFVISLDFELFWGVRDKRSIDSYGQEIKKVHEVVPELLKIFREYHIKTTFATVGFLFAANKDELLKYNPEKKPNYADNNLSPYPYLSQLQDSEESMAYHYAADLIQLIRDQYPEHEIGTHTFSHYYCQEDGQTVADFEADIMAAVAIAKQHGIALASIVFPRNQYNHEYLGVCKKYGISHFRGNEKAWYYAPQSESGTSLKKRIFRTADCYVNLSGHNTSPLDGLRKNGMVDVRSSRFYRPYNRKGGALLEALKIRRIKRSMTHAAKNGELYHLWWHPHNFSANTATNFASLESVLKHYIRLRKCYGFRSMTMAEVGSEN
jgi:peptidoglycan/xylan/chitin deacetylase (PgdA/CDA1 family)